MAPQLPTVSVLLALLPLGGCCSMAQGLSAMFCGPLPPLPRRSHLTPKLALDTFLAAIACDDPKTIYETLSPDLKTRQDLGALEFGIAWERLKEQTPGLHLANQATVSAPETLRVRGEPDPLVRFILTLPLTKIEVVLKKHVYWKVITHFEGEEPYPDSRHVARIGDVVETRFRTAGTQVTVNAPLDLPDLRAEDILFAGAGIEWLVDGFAVVP